MPWMRCLGGGGNGGPGKTRRGVKPLSVSQPIHLLVKSDFEPQCHVFRTKRLRKPRPCHLCHQPVIKQASCCRVCKYICHKACEDKGARFRDTSQQIHKQWQADPARAFPTVGNVGSVIGGASNASAGGGGAQLQQQQQQQPATASMTTTTTGDAASCSPNSTPSPSPSPTSSQTATQNGGYESHPKNATTLARNKHQAQPNSISHSRSHQQHQQHHHQLQTPQQQHQQRTPGVGADASSVCQATKALMTNGSAMVHQGENGVSNGGGGGGRVTEVMELCYVTERIIALWYREDARGVLEHATSLLRGKHADNYMIFNLSCPGRTHEANTREIGWPQGLAPSLERLCALCKELDSWLNAAPNRVVVLHTRGSKERLGVAVSAYMNYSSICGGRDQALDRFAMRRFLDDKIGPLSVPSHRRYIEYFSGLLAGSLRISPSPLYLTHLTVLGVPLFEPSGCRAFLKVYEGLTPVFTSDLYSVTNAREFTVNLGGLRLRGDILVKCYHRIYSNQGREVMFSLQFHTCVVTDNVVSFPRAELDAASEDPRCPPDCVVSLYFAQDTRRLDGPVPAPTPSVVHSSSLHDPILHWDSYTNLEFSDDEGRETPLSPHPAGQPSSSSSPRGLGYTCGPIDGSLYAVVQSSGGGPGGGSASARDARGSPLTVSMDSGISSAPPQRASPPEIPDADAQAHGDLDKLLQDMMLTVESIPDPPTDDSSRSLRNGTPKMFVHDHHPPRGFNGSQPSSSNYSTLKDSYRTYNNASSNSNTIKESSPAYSSSSYSSTLKHHNSRNNSSTPGGYDSVDYQRAISPESKNSVSFSPAGNIDFIDEDIPYHARQTSQPFSYGATNDMIKHQKLSSPSLVRKASVRGANSAPVVDLDEILGENGTTGGSSGLSNGNARPVGSGNLQQHSSARSSSAGAGKRSVSPFAGSNATPEPPPEFANGGAAGAKSPGSEGSDGASWLKQQQLKLAARRDERSPARLWRQESGNRMIGELRNVQRSRLRHDGYQSDSAVLDDDDDVWHPNPNHVQAGRAMNGSAPASPLMSHRTLNRKMNGGIVGSASFNNHNRSRADSVNERPFVAAKRAYEFRKYNDVNSPQLTSILQKYSSGLSNGFASPQLSNGTTSNYNGSPLRQPPRPESRSDSFARTESLLREHSRLLNGSSNHSSPVQVNHVAFDLDKESLASSTSTARYPSRPESRNHNHSVSFSNGHTIRRDESDHHFQQQQQQHQINGHHNPADPLSHNDSTSSWTERSVSPGSVQNSSVGGVNGVASRPQTPAFPVHPRTPYNNASPTVTFASDRVNPQHQYGVAANNHLNNSASSSSNNHSFANYTNNNHIEHHVHHNGNHHHSGYPHHHHNQGYGADRAIYIEERRDVRETGLPPKSPTTQRKDRPISPLDELISHNSYGRSPGTPSHFEYGQSPKSAMSYTSINSAGGHSATHLQCYGSRRSSLHSNSEPAEVADVNVKFVRDTSKIWYKPNISREQAIGMLRDAAPGTFVVRDSNSFPGAFGLALKVATPPPGAPSPSSSSKEPGNELVRHFLIEPTSRGVRLKGCANEPVFSSLSALVYQHSLTAMALPCTLLLPEPEMAARTLDSPAHNSPQQLLAQGAACNVLYLFTLDTESLTGPQAIKKAATVLFDQKPRPSATIVHFKVSSQGITLTDNARKLFFRRHYPTSNISYCGLDTEERTWDFINGETGRALSEHRCFGFVARKPAHKSDNQCHIFAELEPEQPATAIVNFVNKVLMGSAHAKANIV